MIHLWVVVYKPGETPWGEVDTSHQNLWDPKLITWAVCVVICTTYTPCIARDTDGEHYV